MTSPPLRIALVGLGRMGRAVEQLAPEHGCTIVARFDADTNRAGRGMTRDTLADADVAIEFTHPGAAVQNIRAAIAAECPIVVGTTGWYDSLPAITAEVQAHGGSLLWAPNFSLGVAIFEQIVEHAARICADSSLFDVHLLELHHAAKKDAPSGTALRLADAGQRSGGREVPITSVRTGSIPGTHEVLFDGPFEQIRLIHAARDRRVFADGALRAARWLVGRRGVFQIHHVLAASTDTHP